MTRKQLVIFLGYVLVLVLRSAIAEECSQDISISNENCSLTTHNNEIESLSSPQTHEVTTHTLDLMKTVNSSNISVEGLDENTFRPMEPLSSSSPSIALDTTTTDKMETTSSISSENTTLNLIEAPVTNASEQTTSNSLESMLETTTTNSIENSEITTFSSTESPSSEDSSASSTEILETSTSNLKTLNYSENSTSTSLETSTSNLITTTSQSMESSTLNSSEASTHNLIEMSTLNFSERSTTNSMETSTSNTSDDSTSNLIDHFTKTSMYNSEDSSTTHLTELATELPTTENLTESSTENPTEMAMNDETTTFTTTNAADEPKGRALNFSVEEENTSNVLSNMSNHRDEDSDLSEARIHEEDNYHLDDSLDAKILAPKNQIHNYSLSVCEKGGLTYENGEKLELGCESICTCRDGKMDCSDRCVGPYFRRGKKIDDPLCSAKEVEDPCCSILVCAGDTETEPLEMCSYENKTYNRGDTFNKGCTEVCTCEVAGKLVCKPRCPPVTKTSDRCVEVPDQNDFCCLKVLCDVTLDEHDTEKEEEKGKLKVLSAKYINASAILLNFDTNTRLDDFENLPVVEVSKDKLSWIFYKLLPGGIAFVQDKFKYLRLENTMDVLEIDDSDLVHKKDHEYDSATESDLDLQLETEHQSHPSIAEMDNTGSCFYKGKSFMDGDEYNDECESLCKCQNGEMKCLKIQCPTYFGVDVLDPSCIEWETIPPDFVPSPPNCCPDKVHCKNNGSCEYEGRMYKNWDTIPSNVTGCEKKCYCEMGNVECQNACLPVTALPPPTLDCPPGLAVIGHMPDDDCCKYWVCNVETHSETVHNQKGSDYKGQTPQQSTDKHMGPFKPKVPSKVLGPLAVYVNKEAVANNTLNVPVKPVINPNENPFYHKKQSSQNPNKHTISKPSSPKDKVNEHLDIPSNGPLHPNNGKINSKLSKDSRNKLSSIDHSLFVTPPPHSFSESIYKNREHFTPNYYNPPPASPKVALDNSPSHINIHSHGSPDEILQFIHQHPELSNYPSGSVLEIHNIVPSDNTKPPFPGNQALPSMNRPKIHLVPYIVPQNAEGQPISDNLPPGLSLEEILKEFQQNSQALQTNPLAFLPPPKKPGNNGPVLHPLQNGLLYSKLNSTNTGNDGPILPEQYPGITSQQPQDEIIIQSLDAVDPHKVRLSFTVPHIIVGLHGRFEVRYTHNKDEKDLDSWMLTVFAPPNDLIATPSLEFDLTDLKADTEYSIKITVTLRDLHNMPTSKIYKIKTPKEIEPPVIPIDPDLAITDINATWVTVVWRVFTQYELQFIDGIQLRYKEIDGRIYTATPLIHRAITRYTLEKLKPNTKYEIGIYFIPFPGQMTELRAENILHFTTANEINTYGFNVTLEISQIKSQSVEISWNGVPYPEDKYVNVYRAIYQSDSGKEDQSIFKIAKRDAATKIIIRDLKPGTRYRLWLEVYLTNGKIKTSNVEDFITKPRPAPALGSSTQQDKLSRAEVLESKGDYYGPLVIVAILAAIAILSTLILLLILVRRHNQNKAAITPPSTRISQSAYDNPTYKVEIQQETMGL